MSALKFTIFQVSRKGLRPKNEDRMGYCYTRDSLLMVLADGLGGHPLGEVAAQLAVQSMAGLFQRSAKPALDDVGGFLVDGLMLAHLDILRYAMANRLLDTPRTTLVAAVVQDGHVQWVHSGDSRFYLVRNHAVVLRTRDHSAFERSGAAPDAPDAPARNILTTCLGSPIKPEYTLSATMPLRKGDHLMLCSDGLWGVVDDERIAQMLTANDLDMAVPDLVEYALRNGGAHGDNVTCLALHWQTAGPLDGARGRVSTAGISTEAYATTVQSSGLADTLTPTELDEADIDRAVTEINDAIARAARRTNP